MMGAGGRRFAWLLLPSVLLGACTGGWPTLDGGARTRPPTAQVATHPGPAPKAEPRSNPAGPDRDEPRTSEPLAPDWPQGFTQTGLASWYGRKFDGKPTASGEIFDMHDMTAAHREMPLPTYVRVSNLDNQRKVIVKVNDRGPYSSNRVIDLSYAAAAKLGMINAGTARVRIETITLDTENTGSPTHPDIYLQTGALAESDNARALVARLKAMGLSKVSIQHRRGARPVYQVRVGPFRDAGKLAAVRGRLRKHGIKSHALRN